ncbi:unnamed protein product [Anisakis simplex]|uniref:ERAP1_C domain-containing protein n=1 Tax=Anisakis simplex TaxID=6269 RepID=A0A0M3J0U8_ANISI|nr:unnamed protein product [Anisakis simplex]
MYRVWYDESTWAPIRAQLRSDFNAFDELTRAQFISDAIALRERGSLPWSRVIEFASYLSKETEFAPHYAFKSVRDQLMSAFKNTADTPKINKYIQRTFETAYDIGWANNTDWTMAALATLATNGMCKTALPECLEKTKTLFEQFLTNCQYSTTGTGLCNSEVRPDVRRTQYCYGLAQTPTGHELVNRLYEWFKTNSHYFHRDADNLLNAMACTTDDDKMNSFISDIVEGKYPESALHMVAVHDTTDHVLWNYFKLNTEQVIYGVPSFNSYMTAAVGTWNQAENIKEMDDFIAGIELSGDNLAVINELKKNIQQNIDWLAKNRDEIMTAIEQELQ